MIEAWPGRRGPAKPAGWTRGAGKIRSPEALLRLRSLCRAAEASAVAVIPLRVRYKGRFVEAIAVLLRPSSGSVKRGLIAIAAVPASLALRRSGRSGEGSALAALRPSVKGGLICIAAAFSALALRRSCGFRVLPALAALRPSVKGGLAVAAFAALAL